jgi:cytochrome c
MTIRTVCFFVLALCLVAAGRGAVRAEGDVGQGKTLFRTCVACHEIGPDASNDVGPILNDIVGRRAGTRSGYRYSRGMKDAGAKGLVWTVETLDGYLANPRVFVRGTRMAYAGLRDNQQRKDLIAFLTTLKVDETTDERFR